MWWRCHKCNGFIVSDTYSEDHHLAAFNNHPTAHISDKRFHYLKPWWVMALSYLLVILGADPRALNIRLFWQHQY
ncbi:hypothetical protein BJ165DRAFT_1380363, partial [Panaeolus papilionaceus]